MLFPSPLLRAAITVCLAGVGGGEHLRPAALVLVRGLDGDAELLRGVHDPVWVADELARKEDDVGLAVVQVRLGLLRVRDHPHRADEHLRVRLLQLVGERELWRGFSAVGAAGKRKKGNVPGNQARRGSSA